MKKNAIPFITGFAILAIVLVLVLLGSCSKNGQPDITVEISQPKTGDTFFLARQVFVNATISGKETWSRVELWANKLMVQSATAAQVQSNSPTIPWTPIDLGPTMLEVRAYNRSGKEFASAKIAVTIVESPNAITPEPSQEANQPTPTVQPTKENCTVAATLLADLSIPAGTELKPGQKFTKSWRVHNNGSCDWVDYKVVYISGSLLGGNSPSALRTVRSGEVVDISLELTAPDYPGGYHGIWKIQSDSGSLLDTELRFDILIPTPTPTASPTATKQPTSTPKPTSTKEPSKTPTSTLVPSATPTVTPEPTKTLEPSPTLTHTTVPTEIPTMTPEPTTVPTAIPAPSTVVVMNPKDIAKGETLDLSVSCDNTGGHVVSGGYTATRGITIRSSQLLANGWQITAVNEGTSTQRISVHATCLVDPNIKMDIRFENGTAQKNQDTDLSLATGGQITGLGYSFGNADPISLLGLDAGNTVATMKVRNTSTEDKTVMLQAIGLNQATYMNRSVLSKTTKLAAGETKQIEQRCGSGLATGATFANPHLLPITINRPTLNGWLIEVTNTSATEIDFDTTLICFDAAKDYLQPVQNIE